MLLTAFHDEGEDLNQYDNILKIASSLNIQALCANPDNIILNQNKKRYCAGFFATKYESFGGKVKYFGKPHTDIYVELAKRISNFEHKKTLMVGDTIDTDIKGANDYGIHSALVLTGNTHLALEIRTLTLMKP